MQYCKKCGTKISTTDNFCKECGEPNYDRKEKKGLSLKNLAVLFCILCIIDLIFVSCFYDKHNLLDNIKSSINKTFSHKNSETNEESSSKNNTVDDFSHKNSEANEEFSSKNNTVDNFSNKNLEVNQEIFFKNYMKEIQIKIKKKWNPPKYDTSKRTVLLFTVSRNGEISNIRIKDSSGSKDSDNAAIEALKQAAPFSPFAKEIQEESVDIQFTFDYNVFGKG